MKMIKSRLRNLLQIDWSGTQAHEALAVLNLTQHLSQCRGAGAPRLSLPVCVSLSHSSPISCSFVNAFVFASCCYLSLFVSFFLSFSPFVYPLGIRSRLHLHIAGSSSNRNSNVFENHQLIQGRRIQLLMRLIYTY